jgi:hypothetical protein
MVPRRRQVSGLLGVRVVRLILRTGGFQRGLSGRAGRRRPRQRHGKRRDQKQEQKPAHRLKPHLVIITASSTAARNQSCFLTGR